MVLPLYAHTPPPAHQCRHVVRHAGCIPVSGEGGSVVMEHTMACAAATQLMVQGSWQQAKGGAHRPAAPPHLAPARSSEYGQLMIDNTMTCSGHGAHQSGLHDKRHAAVAVYCGAFLSTVCAHERSGRMGAGEAGNGT